MKNVGLRLMNRDIADATVKWKLNWHDDKRAQALMKKVGGRMKNKELWDNFKCWFDNKTEADEQRRAEMVCRRVAARWMKKDLVESVRQWQSNTRNGEVTLWQQRCQTAENSLQELELRIMMKANAGAEAKMKNVGLRLMNRDIADATVKWKLNWHDDKRAQALMKKVGGRMKNKELWDNFKCWFDNKTEADEQRRAEMVCRRVAARWMKKDLVESVRQWQSNTRNGEVTLWQQKCKVVEAALRELELRIMMSIMAPSRRADVRMQQIARDWFRGSTRGCLVEWKLQVSYSREAQRRKNCELAMKLLPWATHECGKPKQ